MNTPPDTITTTSAPSSHKTIAKLNAEITKLRAITAFTKAESEELILNQRYELNSLLRQEEEKYEKAQRQLQKVKEEIKYKKESNEYLEKRIEKKDEELQYVMEERDALESRLAKVRNELDSEHKTKVELLESKISTKLGIMEDLLSKQESIVSSSIAYENIMKEDGQRRLDRLRQMLDTEMEMQRTSKSLRMTKNGRALRDSIVDQKREMESLKKSLEFAMGPSTSNTSMIGEKEMGMLSASSRLLC